MQLSLAQIRLKKAILDDYRIDLLATEILGMQAKDFHCGFLRWFLRVFFRKNGNEGLLLAPRGHGKSWMTTVACAIWLILKFPNIRIAINSATASKAQGFLMIIKGHLEENEKLRDMFGDHVGEKWTETKIVSKQRTGILKEPTVSAYGLSGAVVGNHFDVHFNDDLVTEDNARTKTQRVKLKTWFYMSLHPTLRPDGWQWNIGTRYHPRDLYDHFIESNKEAEPGEKMDIVRMEAIQNEGTVKEKALWEEVFSIKKLKAKRRKMGTIAFKCQYQNDTGMMTGKIFKEEDLQWYRRSEIDINNLRIFQGVDLSTGKLGGDFFALVTKGYDAYNRGYTLDIVHGRYGYRDQMALVLWKIGKSIDEIQILTGDKRITFKHMLSLFRGLPRCALRQYNNVIRCGIESNAYQTVLPDTLLELATDLPITKFPTKIDKKTRMEKYSARFEAHLEFLPDDGTCDNFRDEALIFDGETSEENDDIIDAHEFANKASAHIHGLDDVDDDEEVSARSFS